MLKRRMTRGGLAGVGVCALLLPTAAQARTTIAEGGPVTVFDGGVNPPASPYPSSVQVSGSGIVSHVTVRISGFTHSFPSDVDLVLVGPQGQNVLLMSDASPGAAASDADVTFSDSAAGFVPDGIPDGSYKPTNLDGGDQDVFPEPAPLPPFGSGLSVFNETDPNGTWSLFAVDQWSGDSGSLSGWTLSLTDRPAKLVAVLGADSRTNEGSGKLTVAVTRAAGGQAGTVTYDAGGSGSARRGVDFTPVSGTLTFLPGETLKTFDIPLANDTAAEQPETIFVALTAASGDAALKSPRPSDPVLLVDDDANRPVLKPSVKAGARIRGKALALAVTTTLDSKLAASGSISLPGAARVIKLKAAKANAKGGRAAKLKLKVPSKSLPAIGRALKRRKLSAVVRVTATDGVRRKSSRRIRLKLKR